MNTAKNVETVTKEASGRVLSLNTDKEIELFIGIKLKNRRPITVVISKFFTEMCGEEKKGIIIIPRPNGNTYVRTNIFDVKVDAELLEETVADWLNIPTYQVRAQLQSRTD